MLQILYSLKCTVKIFLKHLFNIKKMTSNQDTLRKRVYAFHEQHFDKPDSFTVNHFKREKHSINLILYLVNLMEI